MGRLRKSTEELDRKGAFDKDPARGRARAEEPVPTAALGDPPRDFCNPKSPTSLEYREIWDNLLVEAKEVRLTSADRTHFEMTCRLIYRCKRNGAKTGDFAQLNKYLGQLGLNPADRSKVQGVGRKSAEGEEEDWNDFAANASGVRVQ
jgi:hypothetical protein